MIIALGTHFTIVSCVSHGLPPLLIPHLSEFGFRKLLCALASDALTVTSMKHQIQSAMVACLRFFKKDDGSVWLVGWSAGCLLLAGTVEVDQPNQPAERAHCLVSRTLFAPMRTHPYAPLQHVLPDRALGLPAISVRVIRILIGSMMLNLIFPN